MAKKKKSKKAGFGQTKAGFKLGTKKFSSKKQPKAPFGGSKGKRKKKGK